MKNKSKKYKIGQLLFVLHSNGILPVKVVEIITREKESGLETDIIVKIPKKDENDVETTELSNLATEENIFFDIEKLKTKMFENARNAIEKLVSKAVEYCNNNYSSVAIPPPEQKNNKNKTNNNGTENVENDRRV